MSNKERDQVAKRVKSTIAEIDRLDALQLALEKKKKGEALRKSEKQAIKQVEDSVRVR